MDGDTRAAFDEGDVMQPFTLGFGRTWLLRVWGRNDLVRSTDRWQALALSLALTLAVIALPVAAALGTAAHDARLVTYTEQAHDRHAVSAAVVSETATILHGNPVSFRATAQWSTATGSHLAVVSLPERAALGDHVPVWVNEHGDQVAAPTPLSTAADYAVGVAVLTWLAVAATLAGPYALLRRRLDRSRAAGWDRALSDFLDGATGHSDHRHP